MNPLTLSDLALIIPLVEAELDKCHAVINDPNASDKAADDAAEMSVLYGNTAGNLQALYETLRQPGSNFPTYEALTKRKSFTEALMAIPNVGEDTDFDRP